MPIHRANGIEEKKATGCSGDAGCIVSGCAAVEWTVAVAVVVTASALAMSEASPVIVPLLSHLSRLILSLSLSPFSLPAFLSLSPSALSPDSGSAGSALCLSR